MGDAGTPVPVQDDRDRERQGWAEESEAIAVAPELGAMVSIRLDPGETRAVHRAARARG